jgi:hypothetical protein
VSSLEGLTGWREGYDRIYLGCEFCEQLLPDPQEVLAAHAFTVNHGIGLTVVTPYVTNAGLQRVCRILRELSDRPVEVVFNDLGVLEAIRRHPNVVPVMGRLLTKQKRCPRINRLCGKQSDPRVVNVGSCRVTMHSMPIPEVVRQHYRASNVDVPAMQRFYRQFGIARAELDCLDVGVAVRPAGVAVSLYAPFAYLTTSHVCTTPSTGSGCETQSCRRECLVSGRLLRTSLFSNPILMRGKTQFARQRLPHPLPPSVDRLVYQPELVAIYRNRVRRDDEPTTSQACHETSK